MGQVADLAATEARKAAASLRRTVTRRRQRTAPGEAPRMVAILDSVRTGKPPMVVIVKPRHQATGKAADWPSRPCRYPRSQKR